MQLQTRLRQLRGLLGVDRSVGYVLFSRCWSTLAGVVTLYVIARFLRPEEQGFYFTFSSILGLQIFFELGFSYTVTQYVSHERAQLSWTTNETLEGNTRAKHRLAMLFKVALRWYGIGAILFFAAVLPAGFIFFNRSTSAHSSVAWRIPWAWLAVAEALMMFTSPFFSFLEGVGLVAQAALVRLTNNILTSLALWFALASGWALLASPIVTSVGVASTCVWMIKRWRHYFIDLLRTPAPAGIINWRHEVWPFQWRIILMWLGFYFMSQLAVPILFKFQGPVIAGQMGLSISITLAVQAVGLAWISTKIPQFGTLVANREFDRLDQIFFTTIKQALSVLITLSSLLVAATVFLRAGGSSYAQRILSPMALIFLLGRMLIDCTVYFLSVYLRAHKQEPLLWISLINAAVVAASTLIFGKLWGALGVALGNFAAVLLTFPVTVWIFMGKRRAWHAPLVPTWEPAAVFNK